MNPATGLPATRHRYVAAEKNFVFDRSWERNGASLSLPGGPLTPPWPDHISNHQTHQNCGACVACTLVSGICCGNYSPFGPFDRPTGLARDEARNGAIGDVALKWLNHFLHNEPGGGLAELAQQLQVEVRPAIASGWNYAIEDVSMDRT